LFSVLQAALRFSKGGADPGSTLEPRASGRLAWLARFERAPARPGAPAVVLIERDGSELHGAAAARVVLSRLPLLFPLFGPLNLPGLRPLWDRVLGKTIN